MHYLLLIEISREIVGAKEQIGIKVSIFTIRSKLGELYLTVQSQLVNWVTFTLSKCLSY